jgi:hypothetical protein
MRFCVINITVVSDAFSHRYFRLHVREPYRYLDRLPLLPNRKTAFQILCASIRLLDDV